MLIFVVSGVIFLVVKCCVDLWIMLVVLLSVKLNLGDMMVFLFCIVVVY